MFGSFMGFNMLMITRGWLVLRLADRISRKRMVLLSEGGNALMALLLATLDLTGVVDFWHVLVIGLVSGSMMASNMPSR